MPTVPASAQAAGSGAPLGRLDASLHSVRSAFAPGQVLADRYRILGLLGRGGMGEVYRADDLTLGQPVSLKFLPPALAGDASLLERFRAEVRLARQVSHPNVCRVYDIGEAGGRTFLSMEFVDGEDLATLLRRIGHLPAAKANEVARQLCAGLAAAHDRGVLHRDLKPSNVMIDGEGRVRITDFGLAVRAEDGATDIAGTPAYMSPEQFAGGPVSVQSDLYALGLILYETFTGKRPFDAANAAEWRSAHTSGAPAPPSQSGSGLDEGTERAILRCLDKDPANRPASALQLAAALPGGDPVAAALAAGETPSPQMVAASGGEGALAPRAAILTLVLVLAGVAGLPFLARTSTDLALGAPPLAASVLHEKAGQVLAQLGLPASALDRADWFERDYERLAGHAGSERSTRWRAAFPREGVPLSYVLRASPVWMQEQDWRGRVTATQPPPVEPGMLQLTLDAAGALRELRRLPAEVDSTDAASGAAVDWRPAFTAAGLDLTRFRPVDPRFAPPVAGDARSEWVGPAPWDAGVALRVAAAAHRGRPTWFRVMGPWTRPRAAGPVALTGNTRVVATLAGVVMLALFLAGGALAYRNAKLGRGDLRGAARLAVFAGTCALLGWAFRTHWIGTLLPSIWNIAGDGIANALLTGAFCASVYLALEPFMRRRLPELLIGWQRVLDGRFRDARVGRDVLTGLAAGVLSALVFHAVAALPTWIPAPRVTTIAADPDMLYGGLRALTAVPGVLLAGLWLGLVTFGVLFVMRLLLRKPELALLGALVVATVASLGGENFAYELPGALAMGGIAVACVARGGLLATCVLFATRAALVMVPLPLAPGAPYAGTSVLALLLVAALAVAAFRTSLGPRLQFARALADGLS